MESVLLGELAGIIGYHKYSQSCSNSAFFLKCLLYFLKPKSDDATVRTLPSNFISKLLSFSRMHHRELPNVVRVNRPQMKDKSGEFTRGDLTIVGDLHGQYEDLVQIFQSPKFGGYPSAKNQFVINGDMVDRGPMGLEIIVVLLVCKLLCSVSVHILRGNHETRAATSEYGFKQEVEAKGYATLYTAFMGFFDILPVAAIVDDTVFVTHGGIGASVMSATIPDIDMVNRVGEVTLHSPVWDLLWAGPETPTYNQRDAISRPTFAQIDTEAFLKRNKLSLLIRSHEYKSEGFDICHDNLCWTVFSAPNYCGTFENTGAVVRFVQLDTLTANVVQFNAANAVKPGICGSFCVEVNATDVDVSTDLEDCEYYSKDFED